ncbi:uncharacterized protein LOC128408442 isoform X2 [Podarcis raffonei]|uniref:uncharacterized protein LOC128408442 isoform X2 n=1 Tax=Podarcis raffonei TaxID=65483 RepID=UPI0023292CB9|nr:uncharacterized protein LOC128408442 isoform X2 [Podarcis raffonei]
MRKVGLAGNYCCQADLSEAFLPRVHSSIHAPLRWPRIGSFESAGLAGSHEPPWWLRGTCCASMQQWRRCTGPQPLLTNEISISLCLRHYENKLSSPHSARTLVYPLFPATYKANTEELKYGRKPVGKQCS